MLKFVFVFVKKVFLLLYSDFLNQVRLDQLLIEEIAFISEFATHAQILFSLPIC